MGCAIDHLRADLEIPIIRDFTDVRGNRHRAGESGVLRLIDLDWATQEIVLTWERDGRREAMTFALSAKGGPRNNAMRDYFEAGEYRPVPRPSNKEKATAQCTQTPEPAATSHTQSRTLVCRHRPHRFTRGPKALRRGQRANRRRDPRQRAGQLASQADG